jgi:drug/metabolite transporter (DMT)-like permease
MKSPVKQFALPFLVLANIMFATEFPAVKLTVGAVGPWMLPFWELLLGALVLLPIFYLEYRRTERTPFIVLRELTSRPNLILFILCAVTALTTNVFLMWGIKLAQASDAALLSLTIPVLAAVLAWMFLRERLTVLQLIAFFIAALGAVVMSSPRFRGAGPMGLENMQGDVLIFLSCASSALYIVVSKPLLKKFTACELLIPSWLAVVVIFAIGISGLRPTFWAEIQNYQFRSWVGIIVVGFVSKGLAMACFLSVLRYLDVAQVVLSTYLLPLFGVLLSVVVAHESISLGMVLGGILVLAANVVMTGLPRMRKKVAAL